MNTHERVFFCVGSAVFVHLGRMRLVGNFVLPKNKREGKGREGKGKADLGSQHSPSKAVISVRAFIRISCVVSQWIPCHAVDSGAEAGELRALQGMGVDLGTKSLDTSSLQPRTRQEPGKKRSK